MALFILLFILYQIVKISKNKKGIKINTNNCKTLNYALPNGNDNVVATRNI
jgi:hypothetical protein